MNNKKKHILFFSFLLLLFGKLIAQDSFSSAYLFTNQEGLSSDKIRCSYKDSRGLLWVGTQDAGLNYFNGTNFSSFPLDVNFGSNLKFDGEIKVIEEDHLKRLWLGTTSGIIILTPSSKNISVLTLQDPSSKIMPSILGIKQLRDGRVFVIAKFGQYFRYTFINPTSTSNIEWINLEELALENKILQDSEGTIWFNGKTHGTVCSLGIDTNEIKTIDLGVDEYFDLDLGRNGQLIITLRVGGDTFLYNPKNDCLIPYEDINNNINISSLQKVIKKTLPKKSNHLPYFIRHIHRDKENMIWLSSNKGLLGIEPNKRHSLFKSVPFFKNKVLRLIQEKSANEFYVSAQKIYTWNQATGNLDLVSDQAIAVTKMLPFGKDSLLINTDGGGFYLLQKGKNQITELNLKIEHGNRRYTFANHTSMIRKDGTIISDIYQFIEKDSLALLKNCRGHSLLEELFVYDIIEDFSGVTWMGTSKGLFKLDNCKIDLVSFNQVVDFEAINTLFEINDTLLLIGTRNNGAILYNKITEEMTLFDTQKGLSDNRICCILSNNENKGVWISTFNGLNYLNFETENISTFYEEDGLAGNEFNSYSACKSSNGDLFFGGMDGMTIIPHGLDVFQIDTVKPTILTYSKINPFTQKFEHHFLDQKKKNIILNPEEKYIEFTFSNSNLFSNLPYTFAYQLKGFDKEWIYSTNNKTARYANLSAGKYEFLVKMKNPDGIWRQSPIIAKLKVEQYFYESFSFKLLLLFLIIVAIYSHFRFRLFQQLKMERLKQKISRDLHDDIGNSLNSIYRSVSFIKEESNTIEVKKRLEKITNLSRNIILNMNDVIWSLDNETNTFLSLEDKILDFAHDILPPSEIKFNYSNSINPQTKLGLQRKYHLLRICKEGLNNAAKHTKKGVFELSFINNKDRHYLLLMKNEYQEMQRDVISTNYGLISMKKRVEILDGEIDVKNNKRNFVIEIKFKIS